MQIPRRFFIPFILFVLIFTLMLSPTAVSAATYSVNSTANDGPGSLRVAITAANASAENDTINITVDDIFLTAALPNIANNGTLTINGNGVSITRAVGAPAFRIFRVNSGANLTLNIVTVIGGDAGTDVGGGIYNFGTLTVVDGLITENTAAWGGGLYNAGGTVMLDDNIITLNTSTTGGGGVLNNGGTVTVIDSNFGDNNSPFGGGAYNFSGALTVTSTVFSGNGATNGGGIINNGGALTVTGGGFDLNTAQSGGAIFTSGGTANLTSVQVISNTAESGGGGISIDGGTVTMTSMIVNGNTISDLGNGGGISVGGGATVSIGSSSITNNFATANGGGLINGGGNSLTLTGNTITGNDAPYGGGIFNGGTLDISGGSVSNNSSLLDGAGINNFGGTVTIDSTNIIGNTIDGSGNGGGIWNSGTLSLETAILTSNLAETGKGGGIANDGGMLNLTATSIGNSTAQTGAGISNLSGTVTLFTSSIQGNIATADFGGAIDNNGTLQVTWGNFFSNQAPTGGAIYNAPGAALTILLTRLGDNFAVSNSGGAIANEGALTLTSSTFTNNDAATNGGGLNNTGTAAVTNSTFSGNSASFGGGISSVGGTMTVANSTLSGNTADAFGGGGVYNTSGATLNLRNTIVANSTSGGECQTVFATTNVQFSIIEGGVVSCATGTNSNNKTTDPALGALTGLPEAFPLNAGSPAIDAGSNALIPAGIFTDQAGNFRIVNGTVDMGSTESSSTLPPEVSINPASVSIAEGSSGIITLTRTGSPAASLTVTLQITPASADMTLSDYQLSGGLISGQTGIVTVTIPPASASLNLNFAVTNDAAAEPDNALTIAVVNTATYTASLTQGSSTVTIPANDLAVTTLADAGEGSLRQAVANANAFNSNDTITFTTFGTVSLTSGQLVLANNGTLTINGGGTITVARSGTDEFRIFEVADNANVTLSALTVTNGRTEGDGGAIYNAGTLALTSSTVSNSTAFSGSGGGIFNAGTLTLTTSTISGNTVENPVFGGGGILNDFSRSLTVTNSTFSGNSVTGAGGQGGAIQSLSGTGTVNITGSTFTGNSTNGDSSGGGAISAGAGSVLNIANSTFSSNSATGDFSNGGAIFGGSTTSITSSTFSGNEATDSGGGVYFVGGGTVIVRTIINSTFSGNEAVVGGGISNANTGTLTVVNTTVSGNWATTGAGLYTGVGAITHLNNSIVANSLSGANCVTASGTTNAANSLIEGGLTCVNGTNTANLIADPNLGTLTGVPAYFPLNSGSPAINTGSNALIPVGITTDQVGSARIVSGTVDMGSFEFGGVPPTASLTVNMALQGRPAAPHASYVVSVQVQVRPTGSTTPIFSQTVSTDTNGQFTISGITPGTYDLRLKANGALARIYPVTLVAGSNTLNIPSSQPVPAGDANGDNVVNLSDFSLLASSFGSVVGNPNYNANADFNNDGMVTLPDFSLLASNYGTSGPA